MHKEKRRILAHDLGLHIEKLGHDGIDGWMMKPSEVIDQLMTLGLILEKLVKDDPIDGNDKSEIRRILGISIEDLFSKSAIGLPLK